MGSTDLEGWGVVKSSRQPIIALDWKSGGLEAQFAIRDHREDLVPINMNTTGVDVYWILPSFVGTVLYNAKYVSIAPTMQWALTNYEGNPSQEDNSAQSWVVKFPLKATLGPLSLTGDLNYGENLAGEFASQPSFAVPVIQNSGAISNTISYGGYAVLQYSQDSWTLTGGVGYEKYDNDEWVKTLGYAVSEYHRIAYYANFAYKVHENITLLPEVLFEQTGDNPETGLDEGSRLYVGLQIRFLF